jgi:hypothetical protein
VGQQGRASRFAPWRIAALALSGEPDFQRLLRKQRRFDRKNVIARDVPGGVDAFENNVQRGRVAFGDIRHAESSARLFPASNAKFDAGRP